MNFKDGPKEVSPGMVVVFTNGQQGKHLRISEEQVEKFGRELVTVGRRQFYLESGQEKSNYIGGQIFSSLKAYEEWKIQKDFINHVTSETRDRLNHLTYNEALEIAKILNLKHP